MPPVHRVSAAELRQRFNLGAYYEVSCEYR